MFTSPGAIALQFGPLTIRWYSVLIAVAILVACWVTGRQVGPFRVAQLASVVGVGVTLATADLLVTRPRGRAA